MTIKNASRISALLAGAAITSTLFAGAASAEQVNTYWNTNPSGVAGASAEGSLSRENGPNGVKTISVSGKIWDTAGDSKSAIVRVKISWLSGSPDWHEYRNSGGHNSAPRSFSHGASGGISRVEIQECQGNHWDTQCGKLHTIYLR